MTPNRTGFLCRTMTSFSGLLLLPSNSRRLCNRSQGICRSKTVICSACETNKIGPVDAVTDLDRDEKVNSDEILTMMQKLECELLHANVRTDMRRIEFEYMLRRDQMKKRYQDGLAGLAAKKIPVSARYHPFSKKEKKQRQISASPASELTQRQKLLQWAYNHGNIWAKTFLHTRNTKKVPDDLRIKTDYLLKHENDLCSSLASSPLHRHSGLPLRRIWLCESFPSNSSSRHAFSSSQLFSVFQVQQTARAKERCCSHPNPLSRVFCRTRPVHHWRHFFAHLLRPAADESRCRRVRRFRLGLISSVLTNLGGTDLLVVDDQIPFQAVAIEWSEEQKCWCIRAMYPNVQFTLEEETTMGMNEGQAKLKPSTYFSIGEHTFYFSTAIDKT